MTARRPQATFDEVADLYDRHRPSYPEALFDDLVAASGLAAGDAVLEIGCGTGQATAPLARRGLRILALEPGAHLAERARRNLAAFPGVRVARVSFEAWEAESASFRLVASAQAFHWVEEAVRFRKSAEVLAAGGHLAVFGNSVRIEASPLVAELDQVYQRHAPALAGTAPMNWYTESGPLRALFAAAEGFGPVSVQRYPWSHTYTTAEYVGLHRTHSNHRLLAPAQRKALHAGIAEHIDAAGGHIEVAYQAHLYLARRDGAPRSG